MCVVSQALLPELRMHEPLIDIVWMPFLLRGKVGILEARTSMSATVSAGGRHGGRRSQIVSTVLVNPASKITPTSYSGVNYQLPLCPVIPLILPFTS